MAIIINDNLAVNVGKPIDSKYLNITTPWTSLSAVWAGIPIAYRYIGLTVNINGAEYWFKNSTADVDLILKSLGGTLSGATNGLHISGSDVVLGGTFTGATLDNTIGGGILKYAVSPTFSDPTQIIDKRYADAVSVGVHPKLAVELATTPSDGNIDLSGGTFVSGSTIDSVIVQNDWRVLIKNQTLENHNGIFVYSAITSGFTRSIDFDFTPTGETMQGSLIPVISGNTNKNTLWVLTTADPITGGTQPIIFTLFSSMSFTAGNSISITGSTISVDISTGTLATALNSKLDTSIFSSYTGLTQPILNGAITGATNGLNKTGREVALGGILTGDTVVQTAISKLTLGTAGYNVVIDPTGIVIGDETLAANHIFTSPADTDISSGSGNLNLISSNICVCGTNMNYAVHPTFTGDTQLVDKKYVDDQASGSTVYNCQSPSTCTVGGLPAGSVLTGCGLDRILEQILTPFIAPSFSSFSMIGGSAIPTIVEIGCVISGSKCFGFGFNNVGNVCANTLCIKDMTAGGNIATNCPISPSPQNAIIATCTFTTCGQTQAWCGCATNTCSTPFGSGSYAVTGLLPYYYGVCTCPGPAGANRPTATCAMVIGGTKVLASSSGSISITFNSTSDDYLWFAVPATVSKVCWCTPSAPTNNGAIGGGINPACNLFPAPSAVSVTTVCWAGCSYNVYISNAQTSVVIPMALT